MRNVLDKPSDFCKHEKLAPPLDFQRIEISIKLGCVWIKPSTPL